MSRPVTKGVVGRKFGMLNVLSHHSAKPDESSHFLCRCDCGDDTKVRDSRHLVDGKRLSCGCSRPRKRNDFKQPTSMNVAGHRYGILTAIKHAETVASTQGPWWLFKCDCGTATLARLKDVRNGNTASCGCMKAQKGKNWRNRKPVLDINRPWRKADHIDDTWLVLLGQRSPPGAGAL